MLKVTFQVNNKVEFIFDEGGRAVSLIQDVREECFLVNIPMKAGQVKLLSIGEEIEGFYYDKDHVYMFISKVLERTLDDNIPLYKLEIPSVFKKVQRRNFVRLPASIPIRYKSYHRDMKVLIETNNLQKIEEHYKGEWDKGYTLDLSGGGARLNLYRPLKPRSIIYMILEDKDLHVGVKGRVIRCTPFIYERQITYHIGIEFIDILERKRDKIIRFIFTKLREIKRKGL